MTQREAVEAWWFDADDFTRERALRLEDIGLLPEDMALDLMMAGVTVTKVHTGDGLGHVIPDEVAEFLESVRQLRSEP